MLLDLLQSSWASLFSTEKPVVLCLGLGSPSSSRITRAQLAFLTETCQLLKVVCGFHPVLFIGIYYFNQKNFLSVLMMMMMDCFLLFFILKQDHQDVSIYDPIFTTEDHLLFEELNMKVTANNNACVFFLGVREELML